MVLRDRKAIVTGGSSGIGRGIALELAREGAAVTVADIQERPKRGKHHERDVSTTTAEEIAKIGGLATFVETDVSNPDHLERLIDRGVEEFGGLDIIVNNAGISMHKNIESIEIDEWDRVMNINLRAAFVSSKLAIPHLKQSQYGRIIHIASVHAFGGGGGPPYAASKAAMVNLVRDTALDVGAFSITVNAICPGYIETAIQDYLTPEQVEEARQQAAIPRFGRPRDIGRAAVFLASDDAEWITGTSLVVDGGYIAAI